MLQNDKGVTALGVAVGFNQRAVVELFLEHGADLQGTDRQGNSPLHYAAGAYPAKYTCWAYSLLGVQPQAATTIHCSMRLALEGVLSRGAVDGYKGRLWCLTHGVQAADGA